MSNIAQSRDLGDPKTVRDFADIVQSPERLKLLLLLSAADIRAVGPGVWNGWKGQLLRTLYHETEPLVSGGHTAVPRGQIVAEAQDALRNALADWPIEEVERFIGRLYPDYWLRTEIRKQIYHARLIRRAEAQGRSYACDYTTDSFTAITELTVFAPNHPRLSGAVRRRLCGQRRQHRRRPHHHHARRLRARLSFLLAREFDLDEDESRRAVRIDDTIEKLLRGDVRVRALLGKAPSLGAARRGVHGCARGHRQQRAIRCLYGHRGHRPRPHGPCCTS